MRSWPVAVLLLVAACSGGSSPAASPTPAPTHTTVATQSPMPLPLPTIEGQPVEFRTPDGNIGCEIQPAYARCDIKTHSWTAPRKPSDCHNKWGTQVEFSIGGKGTFACWFGASPRSAKRVLPLGQAIKVGLVTCRAQASGVTCSGQGNGFLLGRASYRLT